MNEPRALPAPATSTEIYLVAIWEELRRINEQLARLAPDPVVPSDDVELREPTKRKRS